jgi:acid phosphatase family membrane protein YuiD
MPSTHVALSVSVAISIGFKEGWDSAMFALASVMAIVIMADAAGVRRATGEQAKVLNELLLTLFKEDRFKNERMQEFIGHTPFEVIVGAIIGLVIATVLSIHFYF